MAIVFCRRGSRPPGVRRGAFMVTTGGQASRSVTLRRDAGPGERVKLAKLHQVGDVAVPVIDKDQLSQSALSHEHVGPDRDQRRELVWIASAEQVAFSQPHMESPAIRHELVVASQSRPRLRGNALWRRVRRYDGLM